MPIEIEVYLANLIDKNFLLVILKIGDIMRKYEHMDAVIAGICRLRLNMF